MDDVTNIRITTEIWVAAYRTMLEKQGIPIYINKTGDKTAGAIMVKVSTMDGKATVYHRVLNPRGRRCWAQFDSGTERQMNLTIENQCLFDPDLWILEIEDPKGRHHLDQFDS